MKKITAFFLAALMTLSLVSCGSDNQPSTSASPTTEVSSTPNEVPSTIPDSEGKSFTVLVTDLDGSETSFHYTSTAETVGASLLEEGLIAGEHGEWGLMVTSVNGITADWDTENAYWAFYIDGEYAQTGVDSTPLTEGSTYSFVKTISYTVLGEGSTTFYFTVRNVDNTVTKYEIHTDETNVGAALVSLELISGTESEYGLYVTTVNGITADWDNEKTYWAFYIDGEYAQTGVDSTDVIAGAVYELCMTVSEYSEPEVP